MTIGFLKKGIGCNPVLVLHEWLGDHGNYDSMTNYLDQHTYTYYFIDLRGYGLSKHIQAQYSAEESVMDLLELLHDEGINEFHAVGHSMSAMIVQLLATSIPERVRSLVAITPVPACGVQINQESYEFLEKVATDETSALEAINQRTGNRYTNNWLKIKYSMAMEASTKEARLGYLKMFTRSDFSEKVQGLQTPIDVIYGEYDIPLFSEKAVTSTFGQYYPHCQFVLCKNAGHYPMLETPVFLISEIEKFNQQYI